MSQPIQLADYLLISPSQRNLPAFMRDRTHFRQVQKHLLLSRANHFTFCPITGSSQSPFAAPLL